MDHYLYHHQHLHRRATSYAPIPPPHPALNHHHHHHHHQHHHNLLIPNRALVEPTALDFHPPAVLSENPILIPPHIPRLLDHDLRHHHPLASPYHRPTANPNHRRENRSQEASRRDGAFLASRKRGAKNRKKAPRVLHYSSSLDYDQRVREFTPTPKKKQEKRKSAFLRIQPPKPNYGDGDGGIEQLNYAADFDVDSNPDSNSNSNSSRGKDKHGCLGNEKKKTEKREDGPVEVDISFESNSLVAKAVVVPSSSAIDSNTGMTGAVSDKCLTSKRKKRRKALVSVNVSSGSLLGKLSTGAVNSSCPPCLANDTSNSVSQNNVSDSFSKATDNPHGKIKVVQSANGIVSDGIANVQSGKTSSRAVKKKKIIKKVVKKVVKPNSNKSTSPSANILDGTVKADSVKIRKTSMEEKSTTVDKVSIPDCLQSLTREGNLLPEDNKGDVPLLSLGTHSGSQEFITGKGCDIGIKRVGNISKPPSSDSSKEDKRTDPDDCLDVNNSALGLLSMPNTDKVTTSLNGSTSEVNHTDDDKKQSRQNEVSLLPGKDSNLGCPQSSADNLINTHFLNSHNSVFARGRVAGSSSNDLTDRSEENATVCDIGNDDIVGKACCALTLSQDAILEENPDIAIPVTSSGMDSCSSSAKPMTQDDPDCLEQASVVKQGSDSELINSEDRYTFPHADVVNVSGKQVSPSNVMLSSNNCDILQDSNITVGYGEGDTNENKRRKCRALLKFCPSKIDNMSPDVESPVGLVNDVDTTLSLWKDPSPSEIFDQSVQRLDFSSQSSIDGITTLNVKAGVSDAELYFGNSSDIDEIKVSRLYKRKKPNAGYPNFSQCPSELSGATVATTSFAEVPVSLGGKQAHKQEVAWLNLAILSASPSVPYTEDIAKLSDNILVRESVESMDLNREIVSSENLELQLSSIPSHSVLEDLATPNVQFPMLEGGQKENTSPSVTYTEDISKVRDNSLGSESLESMDLNREIVTSENLELQHSSNASHSLLEDSATPNVQFPMLEGEHKENATLIVPSNNETGIVVVENVKVEKIDLQYTEENYPIREFVQRSPCVNMESYGINMKDDLLPRHNCMYLPFDGDVVTSINSNDALIETMPDTFSALPSQGITSEVCDRRVSDCLEINNENTCVDGRNLDIKSMVEQCPDLLALTSTAQCTGKIMKLDHATGQNNLTMGKMMPQPSPVPSEIEVQQSNYSELNGTKKELGCVASKISKGNSFIFSKSKTPASSTHMSKPQTWHRMGNNSPGSLAGSKPSVNVPIKNSNIQNASYIRKGNTLVGKPTPVSASSQISIANQLPSLSLDESRKSMGSESMFSATDQPNLLKTGVQNAPLKGQRLVPLPIDTKLDSRSSPLVVNVSIGCCESATDPKNVTETNDAPHSSEDVPKCSVTFENQVGISNDGANQVEVNDKNVSSSNAKRTVYIKPKSNQLVATSNFCALSADDVTQSACSDGYYKCGKNQLLRTSFASHISPTVIMPNSNVNSDGLGACKAICSRRFTKRRSQKVAGSFCKPLKTSLVWTLCSKASPKNDIDSGNCQKFLSQLFPWKRSIFWRRLCQIPASGSHSSSLSAISKKLLLLRNRDAVYPRSTHGFSLWKTNVLGVGGSSLKWSKSIYRRSTKVIEEAKLAVAAVEREKREQKDVACKSSQEKNDEPLPSASIQSSLAAKEGCIPSYVRIGNGNQLIRDTNKRTRILANEKVRWSLHTARRRLARKQKYCQFFTRFGKCNKDDGKCPYIHDPSKIAVCTKFLNGLCSNANCKLTHKVIPERMPDCSYFLQGLCTNRNCAYRHVNVNSKASVCGEFLKGYCGDGNECRKKHNYVCPTFEATGSCTTGNKCKLHHPKKQGEGRKSERSGHNNRGGRYFGSIPTDTSGPGMMVSQRQWQQSNDKEGDVADYIGFEVDEAVAECVDQSYELAITCDSDPWDSQLDNLDELIRPVLIMKNDFMAQPFSVQNYK